MIFLDKKIERLSGQAFEKATDFIQNVFLPQFNNYHVLVVNGKHTEEELEKRFNQSMEYILSQYSFEYFVIDLNEHLN